MEEERMIPKTEVLDAVAESAELSDGGKKKNGKKLAHKVSNIVVTVLATVAFFIFAVFAFTLIESYFEMKGFDGEGVNGGAIGYAFSLVFMIIATVAVVPLSVAGIVLSATSVKFRQGADRVIGIVTLVLNSLYIFADALMMVVAVIIGNAA